MRDYTEVIRDAVLRSIAPNRSLFLWVIRAPTGYGKSILAHQWAARYGKDAYWLSVSASEIDDDGKAACDRLKEAFTLGYDAFVIDDFDRAPHTVVHTIRRVIESGTITRPLILITREPLPFSIAPITASGQAIQIGPESLLFSAEETAQLVEESMVETVLRLSGGWPIAVSLIARTLAAMPVPNPSRGGALADARDDIGRYILQHIWPTIDHATRRIVAFCASFSSIPEDLIHSGALGEESPAALREAVDMQILLRQRGMIELHPLFKALPIEPYDDTIETGRIALQWLLSHGLRSVALRYAIALDRRSVEEVLSAGTLTLDSPEERRRFAEVLEREVPEDVRAGAAAQVALAGIALTGGKVERAERYVSRSRSLLGAYRREYGDEMADILAARTDIMAANGHLIKGAIDEARTLTARAAGVLGKTEPLQLCAIYTAIAVIDLWTDPGPVAAIEGFETAARYADAGGSRSLRASALVQRAIAIRLFGDLQRAEELVDALLSEIETEGSETHALDKCKEIDALVVAWTEKAVILRDSGRIDEALAWSEKSLNAVPYTESILSVWWATLEQVRLQIELGEYALAERTLRWLDGQTSPVTVPPWFRFEAKALAGTITIASGDALRYQRWKEMIPIDRWEYQEIAAAPIWRTIISGAAVFKESLDPRIKKRYGELRMRLNASGHHFLADRLVVSLDSPARAARGEDDVTTIEELSEREREVLQALADGRSNADLAEELFVSRNTIKTHLQHIYAKLAVANRTQAVAVGRTMGIVA